MTTRFATRLYALIGLAASFVLVAGPARAQFTPRPLSDPATGERYHIEFAAGLWSPSAQMSITSESLGILGSSIDFKKDLALTDQRFPELHLELRAARNHFRFQFIPIKYEQTATLTRDIVFNGQRYRVGVPVKSTLDWKAYRIGYQFDVVRTNRLFAGFILDLKQTDVTATLATVTPGLTEFARARAPIPAIGGVVRGYVVPNISITGEVTGFKLPANLIEDSSGHYVDVDVYGTVNFTNNVGVQVGYRSFDVGYLVDTDTGSFTLKGMFFGIVARY
ncbi:MAG: hypothetical protein ABI868_05780 [Acidobacteriota bacterium]